MELCSGGCPGSSVEVSPPGIWLVNNADDPTRQCTVVCTGVAQSGLAEDVCTSPGVCQTEDVTGGLCRADPTFIGGDNVTQPLPTIHPAPPPAFSPGLTGAPHPVFNGSYTVYSGTSTVSIFVRDASGAVMRTIQTNGLEFPGSNTFLWDGKNDQGVVMPEGTYSYTITEQTVNDLTQYNTQSGVVAIDNTPPVAQLSRSACRPGWRG